jgi:hypothetical protein
MTPRERLLAVLGTVEGLCAEEAESMAAALAPPVEAADGEGSAKTRMAVDQLRGATEHLASVALQQAVMRDFWKEKHDLRLRQRDEAESVLARTKAELVALGVAPTTASGTPRTLVDMIAALRLVDAGGEREGKVWSIIRRACADATNEAFSGEPYEVFSAKLDAMAAAAEKEVLAALPARPEVPTDGQ